MNAVDLFRQTVIFSRNALEDTFKDVDQELGTWAPESRAVCMAAHYAHVVADQDYALGIIDQSAPLMFGSWQGKAGMSAPCPAPGQPFDEWSRTTRFDLAGLRDYGQAVYDASEARFASLTEADLQRPIDLSFAGLGTQPLLFILTAGWIANPCLHAGEISLLKGLRGLKGYPQ